MIRRARDQGQEEKGGIREGGREENKHNKPLKNYKGEVENCGKLGGRNRKHGQETAGSLVGADSCFLENTKEAEREVLDAMCLRKKCRGSL